MLLLLRNLLGSAIHFTRRWAGGSVISTRRGQRIALTVDDSGPGFPVGDHARVRALRATRCARGGDGVGLGVASWESVVVAHRAIIRLLGTAA